MPDFTEKEIRAVIAKARLLGANRYFRSSGGKGIYFIDENDALVAFAKPDYDMWIAKRRDHSISFGYEVYNLADLRKRYEHKHNSRTSKRTD